MRRERPGKTEGPGARTDSLALCVRGPVRAHPRALDSQLDEDFRKTLGDDNFCVYDFNKPVEMPERHRHRYDCAVVDPPFITKECWSKYAETVAHVLRPGGKIILSTIQESAPWLKEMMDVEPTPFRCAPPCAALSSTATRARRCDPSAGPGDRSRCSILTVRAVRAAPRPSIPHLVYQYAMYTNFEPTKGLSEKNPEIPDDD